MEMKYADKLILGLHCDGSLLHYSFIKDLCKEKAYITKSWIKSRHWKVVLQYHTRLQENIKAASRDINVMVN